MKNTSRILAAIAILALPAAAQAQAITGAITASADIATVFSFGSPTALNFGSIVPGSAASASGFIPLSRNVGVLYSLPDGANTGKHTLGAVTLTPTYTCGVGATSAAITSAFSSCTAAAGVTVLSLVAPASSTTEYVIFNGSLAAAATNVAPGTYVGTIRITATPN
jgi:hypothetical protein